MQISDLSKYSRNKIYRILCDHSNTDDISYNYSSDLLIDNDISDNPIIINTKADKNNPNRDIVVINETDNSLRATTRITEYGILKNYYSTRIDNYGTAYITELPDDIGEGCSIFPSRCSMPSDMIVSVGGLYSSYVKRMNLDPYPSCRISYYELLSISSHDSFVMVVMYPDGSHETLYIIRRDTMISTTAPSSIRSIELISYFEWLDLLFTEELLRIVK